MCVCVCARDILGVLFPSYFSVIYCVLDPIKSLKIYMYVCIYIYIDVRVAG